MAIQIDLATSKHGVAFVGAYFRIITTVTTREADYFRVVLDCAGFATSEITDNTHPVDFKRYEANLAEIEATAGDDFLSKCYTWVMAQSDMDGSTAV